MAIDLSTFVALALIFLSIAYKHRQGRKDADQFHIASWSASAFAVVASVLALFGAGEISTFTDLYAYVGSGIIVFFIGAASGFACLYFLSDRFFIETREIRNPNRQFSKAYHINDVVYDRYGGIASTLFTLLAAFSLLALYLIQVIVGSDLIAVGSGVDYRWAVIGVSLFVASYVIISGLEGIYSTDKIQIIALFAALVFISFNAVKNFEINVFREYAKVFERLDGVTSLTLFFPGFFAVVGADVLQRIISVKSSSDLKRISLTAAIGWILLGMILVIFSAGITSGYPSGETPGFIQFLSEAEGPSRVIMIVALVCALLSTADTEAHSIALLINRGISPHGPPTVTTSRIIIAAVCLAGLLLALEFKNLAVLYGIMLNIFLILGPVVFAIVFRRGNTVSVITTICLASALLIYYGISDTLYGSTHLLGLEILALAGITSLNLAFKNKDYAE